MKDGTWRDVAIPEDCFTINLGDLMQRWTNDRWKSTVHRVVPPPVDVSASVLWRCRRCVRTMAPSLKAPCCYCIHRCAYLTVCRASLRPSHSYHHLQKVGPDGRVPENRRQSVAFFHNLNRDAVCSVFPSCVDAEHPCLYEPISAFEHLMSRHAKATGMKKHLASGAGAAGVDAPAGGAGASALPAASGKVGGADITGAAWAKAEGK